MKNIPFFSPCKLAFIATVFCLSWHHGFILFVWETSNTRMKPRADQIMTMTMHTKGDIPVLGYFGVFSLRNDTFKHFIAWFFLYPWNRGCWTTWLQSLKKSHLMQSSSWEWIWKTCFSGAQKEVLDWLPVQPLCPGAPRSREGRNWECAPALCIFFVSPTPFKAEPQFCCSPSAELWLQG